MIFEKFKLDMICTRKFLSIQLSVAGGEVLIVWCYFGTFLRI